MSLEELHMEIYREELCLPLSSKSENDKRSLFMKMGSGEPEFNPYKNNPLMS